MTTPRLSADYAQALAELGRPWTPILPEPPAAGPGPRLLAANDALAAELGIDADWLHTPEALAVLGARAVLPGSQPVAQAYAGHQFGSYSPLLGDGRAVLLGEITDRAGRLRDIGLKGSGRTGFARGGDGRAVLGPVLREYLLGEAMHALGVPTTRALAAVTTGDAVLREGGPAPGAVLTRVAASHLRIGTFEVVARSLPPEQTAVLLPRLLSYAAARHHPGALTADEGVALGLLGAVVEAQAALLAQWLSLGFIHGVMNTDNMTISGETIDYGPAAWLETYDESAVFSSIDRGGRYRFGHQPSIALWNLSRLAETLLPLVADDQETAIAQATAVLDTFEGSFRRHWLTRMRAKLALDGEQPQDFQLVIDLLASLAASQADYTLAWRSLARLLRDEPAPELHLAEGWLTRWRARLGAAEPHVVADAMDRVNPAYVPRNHLVEHALERAVAGDLEPFQRLLAALTKPFAERPDRADLAAAAPPGFTESHVTYCGT